MDDLVRFLRARLDEDEARVLAEVEAKRQLLDGVYRQVLNLEDAIHGEFSTYPEVDVPELLLKTLALPYAEHPDCRPEWRS